MLTSRLFGGTRTTSSPYSRIWPVSGRSNPASIRSVVVLPQPEGPSSEKNSPPAISRSMPRTAGTPSYALVRSTSEIAPPLTRSTPLSTQHRVGEPGEVRDEPVGIGRGVLDRDQPFLALPPWGKEAPAIVLHQPVQLAEPFVD